MSGRQCAHTGVLLIDDFSYGYRIATKSWGR